MARNPAALPPEDYRRYINSSAWRTKREAYWKSKFSKDCQGCGRKQHKEMHLHHRTYKRLGMERLVDLVPLCAACHEEIHATLENWRDLYKHTNKELKRMRNRRGLKRNSRGDIEYHYD